MLVHPPDTHSAQDLAKLKPPARAIRNQWSHRCRFPASWSEGLQPGIPTYQVWLQLGQTLPTSLFRWIVRRGKETRRLTQRSSTGPYSAEDCRRAKGCLMSFLQIPMGSPSEPSWSSTLHKPAESQTFKLGIVWYVMLVEHKENTRKTGTKQESLKKQWYLGNGVITS